jgi:hypothetical protein
MQRLQPDSGTHADLGLNIINGKLIPIIGSGQSSETAISCGIGR